MATWPYSSERWQTLRSNKLARNPHCYACGLRGVRRLAHAVDHVVSIASGGDPFPPLSGLMSLCVQCHNSKTSSVDRPDRRSSDRRFKGFDADGNPVDPGDFWNGGPVKDGNPKGVQTAGGTDIDLVLKKLQKRRP
jgi:5-methylcytosine-specific restriction enzyme A